MQGKGFPSPRPLASTKFLIRVRLFRVEARCCFSSSRDMLLACWSMLYVSDAKMLWDTLFRRVALSSDDVAKNNVEKRYSVLGQCCEVLGEVANWIVAWLVMMRPSLRQNWLVICNNVGTIRFELDNQAVATMQSCKFVTRSVLLIHRQYDDEQWQWCDLWYVKVTGDQKCPRMSIGDATNASWYFEDSMKRKRTNV